MAELKGTQVAAAIVPFTDLDTYATHDAEYGKGGFRSVDTNAKRDAIPAARKVKGMVVRVNETGLHYYWNGSAWTEWLPKSSILVDAMFDIYSTNPVQNKVITTRINEHAAKFDDIYSKIENIPTITIDTALSTTSQNPVQNKVITNQLNALAGIINGIPIITVDTVWNATSNNPASSKAIDSTISPIRTTANAAIPKRYIDTTLDDSASDTRVPSTKLLNTITSTLVAGVQNAQDSADSAYDKANAAIPKSKIDTSIDGTETAHDAVPSVGATVTYVKSQRTAIDGSINAVSGRVTTLETWKNGIGNKGAANGVAGLDSTGKVPSTQLPSYVDDVIDLINFVYSNPTSGMTIGNKYYNTTSKKIFTATSTSAGVESTPEAGKIYINIATNKTYRWSGSTMAEISASLALGTTSTTAFRGDYGNTLYTNFGSGTNLTGTQDARDFFIHKEGKEFIQSIIVSRDTTKVNLSAFGYNFDLVSRNINQIIPAADAGNAGVMTADMYNTFQQMELATFPLNLNIVPSSNSVFEKGSSYTPTINISVYRKGTNVTSESNINVVGEPTLSGSISSDKQTWIPTKAVTANQKLTVTATYGSQSASKVYYVFFKNKKYWGTSANTSLTNAQVLALAGSTWADNRLMESTKFDCTGGKYPYYVIPANVYNGLQVWVGGLKNTDITVTDMTVTNASGYSQAYKVIRLTNIQTGVLSIEFK